MTTAPATTSPRLGGAPGTAHRIAAPFRLAAALAAFAVAPGVLGAQQDVAPDAPSRPAARGIFEQALERGALAPVAATDSLSARMNGRADVPPQAPAQGAAATSGFTEGHLYVGPRIWAGVYGTLAFGAHIEKAITPPRSDFGNGRFGVSASIDMYQYSDQVLSSKWTYRVIPISGMFNYHVTIASNPKIDPFIGLGLGYYIVSSSYDGPGGSINYDARANALFFGMQLGARYFFNPNLAVQAQTGFGLGALSLGLAWKL